MQDELAIVNSSNAFWQRLDSAFSRASCCQDKGEQHFHMAGKFLAAQEKISEAISVVFGDGFDSANFEHRNHLFTLAAVQKAQDQLTRGKDFVSQRTKNFNQHFKISDNLAGKKIAGEIIAMPDAKKYLVKKFNLDSTRAKADVIIATRESVLKKAGDLVDLGFKDTVDPLLEISQSVYTAAPSLAVAGLTLGTAQMILRSAGDQESANKIRDNIGASTEAAAFFVLVNGVLENLSHSFILAAPALATVAAYDKAHPSLKRIYDYFKVAAVQEPERSGPGEELIEIEVGGVEEDEAEILGSFSNHNQAINLLQRAESLINEDQMWLGLRKHQLVYADNCLEVELKSKIRNLIAAATENPSQLNQLLQQEKQTVCDSFSMLQAYLEVYRKDNPASGVDEFVKDFCDYFSRDAILLLEPSENARSAAFYCKSHAGLISFEERLKESLPHMPTGQQVLLAATVIGALYSASTIYKAATGEEEVYSDYVTNFPDHLFEWLQLDQMYQNMGGGAEATEAFKDFFAVFNLAENSTHLGIAVAPFVAYSQMGSKMFEGVIHKPINYLAYAADLTGSYILAANKMVSGWFEKKPATVFPSNIFQTQQADNLIDLVESKKFADAETQTDLKAEEDKDSKDSAEEVYCGSGPQFLAQMQSQNMSFKGGRNKGIAHKHGPSCKH